MVALGSISLYYKSFNGRKSPLFFSEKVKIQGTRDICLRLINHGIS